MRHAIHRTDFDFDLSQKGTADQYSVIYRVAFIAEFGLQ